MNEELQTTFIVLQTLWDFWLICCLSFFACVIISLVEKKIKNFE